MVNRHEGGDKIQKHKKFLLSNILVLSLLLAMIPFVLALCDTSNIAPGNSQVGWLNYDPEYGVGYISEESNTRHRHYHHAVPSAGSSANLVSMSTFEKTGSFNALGCFPYTFGSGINAQFKMDLDGLVLIEGDASDSVKIYLYAEIDIDVYSLGMVYLGSDHGKIDWVELFSWSGDTDTDITPASNSRWINNLAGRMGTFCFYDITGKIKVVTTANGISDEAEIDLYYSGNDLVNVYFYFNW